MAHRIHIFLKILTNIKWNNQCFLFLLAIEQFCIVWNFTKIGKHEFMIEFPGLIFWTHYHSLSGWDYPECAVNNAKRKMHHCIGSCTVAKIKYECSNSKLWRISNVQEIAIPHIRKPWCDVSQITTGNKVKMAWFTFMHQVND